jgi:hypothetical protein
MDLTMPFPEVREHFGSHVPSGSSAPDVLKMARGNSRSSLTKIGMLCNDFRNKGVHKGTLFADCQLDAEASPQVVNMTLERPKP